MTTAITVLNSDEHRRHGFRRPDNFRHALSQPAVAIHIGELLALMSTLPLAFAKLPSGKYLLVVVTGFADGRNLMIDDQGRWCGSYMPSQYRAYPFSLREYRIPGGSGQEAGEETRFALCFDRSSELYRETPEQAAGEERFFNDEGQPQKMIDEVTNFLADAAAKQQLTQQAVNALADAEVLVRWQLSPGAQHPEYQLPPGLYRIDEAKLNQVDGDALTKLHKAQALAVAYAQLFSMTRVAVLQRLYEAHRKNRRGQQAEARGGAPGGVDHNLVENWLNEEAGETLKFNW